MIDNRSRVTKKLTHILKPKNFAKRKEDGKKKKKTLIAKKGKQQTNPKIKDDKNKHLLNKKPILVKPTIQPKKTVVKNKPEIKSQHKFQKPQIVKSLPPTSKASPLYIPPVIKTEAPAIIYQRYLYYSQPLGFEILCDENCSTYEVCSYIDGIPKCEEKIIIPDTFTIESHFSYFGIRFDQCFP